MYRCIVIEDEPLAADILKNYISLMPNLILLEIFNNAIKAQEFLLENTVDIIFLDIHLPKMKGFEFMENLDKKYFVILTTAYSDYALKGFEKGVIDYLLKPITFSRFKLSIDRIVDLANSQGKDNLDLVVKVNKSRIKLNQKEIIYIESNKGYVNIHTYKNKIFRTKMTTQSINDLLSEDFVRIHKSYIVNKKYITSYSASVLVLNDTLPLPIGRKFKGNVTSKISLKS